MLYQIGDNIADTRPLFKWYPPMLVFGCLAGFLVALDPFIANILASQLDIRIKGENIIRLFPFEVTTLVLILVCGLFFLKKCVHWFVTYPEKLFFVILLIGFQAQSLTKWGKLDLVSIALFIFLLVIVMWSLVRHRRLKLTGIDLITLLLALSVFLSAITAGLVQLAINMLTMTKIILISFLIVNAVRNRGYLVFFLKCFVIMTVISSLIAIMQEILYLTTHILVVGVVDQKTLNLMFETTSYGDFLRVPAFFGTYKSFSFALNAALMIILNYFLYNRPLTRKKLLIITFSFSVMFTALLLTFSKDGWIAFATGCILSLIIWRPYLVFHLLLCVLATVLVITVFGFWDDISEYFYKELYWEEQRLRLQLAREGLSGFIHRHPLVGAGPTFAPRYTGNVMGWPVHNIFIETADAVGIIGLCVYLSLFLFTLRNLIKAYFLSRNTHAWVTIGLLCGFVSYGVSLQFHPGFLEKLSWLFFGIIQANACIVSEERIRLSP